MSTGGASQPSHEPLEGGMELHVYLGGELFERLAIEQRDLLIGRHAGCALRLDDPLISRRHALLRRDGDVYLEDLGSRNGTRVNGRRIHGCYLVHGDEIRIGPFLLELRNANRPPDATAADGAELPRTEALHPPDERRPSGAMITVMSGDECGRIYDLRRPFVALGELGVRVAVVTRRQGRFTIRGGTGCGPEMTLNGVPLDRRPRPLQDGDRIVIGNDGMVFRHSSIAGDD